VAKEVRVAVWAKVAALAKMEDLAKRTTGPASATISRTTPPVWTSARVKARPRPLARVRAKVAALAKGPIVHLGPSRPG
jgi:hypothetical protein